MGGKTIFVPQTGELAFVGFGTSVARFDKDPALQKKHALNAERIAKMRAIDALCGVILGDTVAATAKLDSQTTSMLSDFAEATREDPVARQQENAPSYQALAERKKQFLSMEVSSESITSLRKGVVPPGVKTQSWMDDAHAFAYGMAVYLPSATQRADEARKQMREGSIVQPPQAPGSAPKPGGAPDAGTLKQSPSGRVQSDDAL